MQLVVFVHLNYRRDYHAWAFSAKVYILNEEGLLKHAGHELKQKDARANRRRVVSWATSCSRTYRGFMIAVGDADPHRALIASSLITHAYRRIYFIQVTVL